MFCEHWFEQKLGLLYQESPCLYVKAFLIMIEARVEMLGGHAKISVPGMSGCIRRMRAATGPHLGSLARRQQKLRIRHRTISVGSQQQQPSKNSNVTA